MEQVLFYNRASSHFWMLPFIDFKHETKTAATARRIHTALKAAFNDAVRWEYIRSNPFKEVKKPRLVKKDPEWLDVPSEGNFEKVAGKLIDMCCGSSENPS